MFGEPIPVVEFVGRGLGPDGEPHHDDARALTAQITASLQAVSPGFVDVEAREVLRAAARVERSDDRHPSFADTEIVARRLATAPAEAAARSSTRIAPSRHGCSSPPSPTSNSARNTFRLLG